MTRADFTREFAEILNANPEDLKPETQMSSFETWDSVAYLSAMILVDEKLSVKTRPDMLSRAQTFGDILSAVGSALED
jgi:acyl carrier protein